MATDLEKLHDKIRKLRTKLQVTKTPANKLKIADEMTRITGNFMFKQGLKANPKPKIFKDHQVNDFTPVNYRSIYRINGNLEQKLLKIVLYVTQIDAERFRQKHDRTSAKARKTFVYLARKILNIPFKRINEVLTGKGSETKRAREIFNKMQDEVNDPNSTTYMYVRMCETIIENGLLK